MWCPLRVNFVDNGIWLILAVLMSDRQKEGGVAAQICPGGEKLVLVGVWLTPIGGIWLTVWSRFRLPPARPVDKSWVRVAAFPLAWYIMFVPGTISLHNMLWFVVDKPLVLRYNANYKD